MQAKTFTISHQQLSKLSKQRGRFVGLTLFIGICVYCYHYYGGITPINVLVAAAIGYLCGYKGFFGRHTPKYPWVFLSAIESEWELVAAEGVVEFHRDTAVSYIHGNDIHRLTAKFRRNKLKWFDIYYNNQRTRVQFYDELDGLYRHVRRISSSTVKLTEIRS